MRLKIIIYILLLFLITAAQLSFVSGLPAWPRHLNLVLVFLSAILLFGQDKLLWPLALGAGALLDSVSFYPAGIHVISLCLTLAAGGYLLGRFFTNRSVYTFFALAVIISFIYAFMFAAVRCLFMFFPPEAAAVFRHPSYWIQAAKAGALNGAALAVVFYGSILAGRGWLFFPAKQASKQ